MDLQIKPENLSHTREELRAKKFRISHKIPKRTKQKRREYAKLTTFELRIDNY